MNNPTQPFQSEPTKKRLNRLFAGVLAISLLGLWGCDNPVSDADPDPDPESLTALVLNEGNFSDSNGSITSYDPTTEQVRQERFMDVNNRPLAAIIQTGVIAGERLYLVANSSDKLEVLDLTSLESLATLDLSGEEGLTPAGFARADESKGYLSGLYANEVAVLDLDSHGLTGDRIPTGANPQELLIYDGRLYVANNGFGNDRTLTVIDTDTDQVLDTIEVGHGPIRLTADDSGRIWVVSNGHQPFNEPENNIEGRLDLIEGATGEHLETIETGGFPRDLALDEQLGIGWLVNSEAVQRIDLETLEIIDETFIPRSFNGIAWSAADERLYLADSRGYSQAGQVIFYNLEAEAIDSLDAGIAPHEIHIRTDRN